MKVLNTLTILLFSLFLAGTAQADEHRKGPVTIPFVDLGGIEDWRPVGDEAILIKTRTDEWYHASFFSRCMGLNYSTAVGFVTQPAGSLDKFSSILVDGERCWFKDLTRIPESELEKYHQ